MVTIAIPFYNAEKYLLDAIKSVFAQTYKDWELILIDDGSTDNSLAIAKSINDPRVRVYSDGKNKKLAARLNEITHLAKYDFIARMDADDLMHPQRLEIQYNILKNNPDLDMVSTGVYSVLNDLSLVGKRGSNFTNLSYKDIISKRKGLIHASLLVKKKWYENNFYDESLSIAQDLDLWLRSSKNDKLNAVSIDKPLYIYREEINVTHKKLLAAYNNEMIMILKYNTFLSRYYIKVFMKSVIIRLLKLLNISLNFQKNRNFKTSLQEEKNFHKCIRQILKYELPLK